MMRPTHRRSAAAPAWPPGSVGDSLRRGFLGQDEKRGLPAAVRVQEQHASASAFWTPPARLAAPWALPDSPGLRKGGGGAPAVTFPIGLAWTSTMWLPHHGHPEGFSKAAFSPAGTVGLPLQGRDLRPLGIRIMSPGSSHQFESDDAHSYFSFSPTAPRGLDLPVLSPPHFTRDWPPVELLC